MKINIIGAGLAGCEAAYQLSKNGYAVRLFENKSINPSPVQKIDGFAELVCSNTLRSKSKKNAVGILKEEMKLFDSLIIRAAYETNVPGDDALAVDRIEFSKYITNYISNDPNIEIVKEDVSSIDDENEITIIASGPLTSENLRNEIQRLIGNQKLYFMDASAPIIKKESIDFSKVYWSSRHKTNDGKYICIPLNEDEFNNFRNELINAEVVESKDFEKEIFFKGCQPIEQLAKIGVNPLLNGPMSPNQLEDENGEIPFAVVQLRQDDAVDSLYNFVGFQTNMKWSEQLRVLKTLPGMENIEIVRYGVMHKNYYINSPKILNHKLQVKRKKNVFFTGQITGVEGYVESASSGIVASLGVLSLLNNQKMPVLPRTTMIGALNGYITNEGLKHLNPMKANLGILDTQNLKKEELPEFFNYERAINDLNSYLKDIKFYK